MGRRIGRVLGRTALILLAAGLVSLGMFAFTQTVIGSALIHEWSGFGEQHAAEGLEAVAGEGGAGAAVAPAARLGEPPARGEGEGRGRGAGRGLAGVGEGPGRREGGGGRFSLSAGLAEVAKDVLVFALLIAAVALVQRWVARRRALAAARAD